MKVTIKDAELCETIRIYAQDIRNPISGRSLTASEAVEEILHYYFNKLPDQLWDLEKRNKQQAS